MKRPTALFICSVLILAAAVSCAPGKEALSGDTSAVSSSEAATADPFDLIALGFMQGGVAW